MIGCDSEKKLMPHNPSNAYQRAAMQRAVGIFQVGNATTVYPLVIYSLAVYADALFTDAGYPLQCITPPTINPNTFFKNCINAWNISKFVGILNVGVIFRRSKTKKLSDRLSPTK